MVAVCGPCRTLGPIIEKVVDATEGKVVLVKVNTDENPGVSQAFRVQSIPAVYALRDGQVVDGFIGAYPEHEVKRFVDNLMPTESETELSQLSPRRRKRACARPSSGTPARGRTSPWPSSVERGGNPRN